MRHRKLMKTLGFLATTLGMVTTVVTEWVKDREIDEKIKREVEEALAKSQKMGS